MELRDAVTEWNQAVFMPVYVMYGTDRYRMEQGIEHLIGKLMPDDERELGVVRMDLSSHSLDEVLDEAETFPFLVHRKCIIVRDSSVFCAATSARESRLEHNMERLLEYMKQPSDVNVLIFSVQADKLDERKKIVKAANSKLRFDELSGNDLAQWMLRKVRELGRTAEPSAMARLVMRVGEQAQQLVTELEKLALFVGDGGHITDHTVDELCEPSVEENVFALIDAMIERKVEQAIYMLRALLLRKEEPIKIAALAARQLRMMIAAQELSQQGYSPAEMASKIGMHPYALKVMQPKVARFKSSALLRALERVAELDYRMKTGQIDKALGLELFILSLAKE